MKFQDELVFHNITDASNPFKVHLFPTLKDTGINELYTVSNNKFVVNVDSTFCAEIKTKNMESDGINYGDYLIIDDTIIPVSNCYILCILNGRYAVKRLILSENMVFLTSIRDETQIEHKIKDLEIIGVITNILHIHQNLKKYFENHFL